MDDNLKNFFELDTEKLNLFLSQDPSTGDFDVVFEIGGKKLYAHKSKLSDVSTTFFAMLSDRWTSSNEPIKLASYSFDDFKEFLTFIYSGGCKLDHDNISAMVDIAEFYDVKVFKKVCEDFLLKVVLGLGNVYQMLELAYTYSLENLKKPLLEFVSKNLLSFIKFKLFLSRTKPMIYDVVKSYQSALRQEDLFEMVFKWAEHQESSNESIKEKLRSILPLFKYHMMQNDFLIDFVVPRAFLFTGYELNQILSGARYLITVKDEKGKMMKGVLKCPDIKKVLHIIQSQKCVPCYYSDEKYSGWKLLQSIKPSEPCKLIKKPEVEWYLICSDSAHFSIRHQSMIDDKHYLLAQLTAEDGFQLKNSKIV